MKSWTPPTNEMVEKALSSVKKETDREYFFSRLNNPLWIEPLCARNYFSSPPSIKHLPNGYVQFPAWPELTYLTKVARESPEKVVDIVLAIPQSDNPRVYDEILSIALQLEPENSAKLLPKLVEYTDLKIQFLGHRYKDLLQYWANQGNIAHALEIAKRIICFQPDPRSQEKRQLRKKDINAFGASLEPAPRFKEWDYVQILEKGMHLLAEKSPYETACILINAVSEMIRLDTHANDIDEIRSEDFSEIWCPRLDSSDQDYQTDKQTLVFALTHACKRVYENSPELIEDLDLVLRKNPWLLFLRLRQYLYASYPSSQNLQWIRELILGYKDYSEWEYHYELQLMIRHSCENFGNNILSDIERSVIIDAILSGPSKDAFKERLGDSYSEDAFQKRKDYFHQIQLRPFSSILAGDVKDYFNLLESKEAKEVVNDESYSPFKMGSSGIVNYRSPKSPDEMNRLSDEELLSYLNDWEDEHRDNDNWLEEINISALSDAFQYFFAEKIIPDSERLEFWMNNREGIQRPIYISSMLKAMKDNIANGDFSKVNQWLEFCEWVMLHSDPDIADEHPESRDKSREHPDWRSSRRVVVDFIDACVQEGANSPISIREGLSRLLKMACTQSDWRLDINQLVFSNQRDPYSEAINNTRSRAIESLVKFGFWVRRHLPDSGISEIPEILATRIVRGAEYPLSIPEYSLLGVQFGNLFILSREWIYDHKDLFFPQLQKQAWLAAFGGYILYNRHYLSVFECLQSQFKFAIESIDDLINSTDNGKKLADRLGQSLFLFYLWKAYPLTGSDSLLELFYKCTNHNRELWTTLFSNIGHLLKNSSKNIQQDLVDRSIDFFNWRLSCGEAQELKQFTAWLEADCLDPEWRLRTFLQIVDLGHARDIAVTIDVRSLNSLLDAHPALVVECLARLTDNLDQNTQIYIFFDEASPIIKAGLHSEEVEVRHNAERARENLLKLGRFDFLDLE